MSVLTKRTNAETPVHGRADQRGATRVGRGFEGCRPRPQAGGDGATLYRWKKKYGGMQASEAKRLKALEEENRQLKRLVADQALNLQVVKDLL